MPIIFHMAPCKPVQLLWGLSYDSYRKGLFLADLGTHNFFLSGLPEKGPVVALDEVEVKLSVL